jgi:hypothetical protein
VLAGAANGRIGELAGYQGDREREHDKSGTR